jgi:hypothetical protein
MFLKGSKRNKHVSPHTAEGFSSFAERILSEELEDSETDSEVKSLSRQTSRITLN